MTTASIPANVIVNVSPSVIAAGGTGLDLNGLILTNNAGVPIGTVSSFPNVQAVSDFFGPLATETSLATVYFSGFEGSNIKPAALLFAQYPATAVPGYLRSGSMANVTLTQIQAFPAGTLQLAVNGLTFTSGTITLSGASSFSNAAALIQTALGHYDAVVTGSIATTTLTVTAVASGTLAIGQILSGAGITAGTKITALGTGTGGTGTYTVTPSQSASSTTVSAGQTLVTYDSQLRSFVITSGTPGENSSVVLVGGTASIPTNLKLTTETGALRSDGAVAGVPATAMAAVTAITQNFASFMTTFLPSTSDMVAFAAWANGTDDRYAYVLYDTNSTPTEETDPSSAGGQIQALEYSGTVAIFDPSVTNGALIAAFVMGYAASLDFAQTEGRTTLDLRSQDGLTPGVTSATVRANLLANGYNFYGSFATANDSFTFFNQGLISGDFLWADSYFNQIWLNNGFQLALMGLLTSTRSIPYNDVGYALIESAMLDQVTAAVNFGAIRAGVPLSTLQAAQVNAAAGFNISDTIAQRGWYILVLPATPEVRAARGSPPVSFFYTDGQSIQTINLASVEVQ